jgi:Heterokaryon incompatibility protein (HET)
MKLCRTAGVIQHFSVYCDGKHLAISKCLYIALGNLRSITTSRVLWADAICIYSHRTTMNYFESLRFGPQFFEGFNFTHLASQIWQYIRLRFQFAVSLTLTSLFASPARPA